MICSAFIEEGKLNDTRLYRCLDRILPHKTKLERHLKQRYGELFGAEFDVLLYDLTSTYVEGAAEKNPMMRRGYSRDHRPDCEQIVIALIVNNEGFPFSYETFDGNRADVSTMETILRMVERKYGQARRIWVLVSGPPVGAGVRPHGSRHCERRESARDSQTRWAVPGRHAAPPDEAA
jgi:transposase